MHLVALPALTDNYIWLLHDTHQAVVIDPGESGVVERALETLGLNLQTILLTHHHADHIGGAAALQQRHGALVYAPVDERVELNARRMGEGDSIVIEAPACRFEVIEVPGHTRSHIAFHGEGLLFSGDTMFSLGCGRLFEGSPAQMLASLDRLGALPEDTMLCCGHEYTLANGRFAATVEPDNHALKTRLTQAARQRAEGEPTLPSSLGQENATNPFMRVDTPALIAWGLSRNIAANARTRRFAALRDAKNRFTG